MQINKNEQIMAVREGGWVQRWHTERTIKEDTVAAHSHQMLVLGYMIFEEEMSPALCSAITFHDAGHEGIVGDWPYAAKGPLSDGEARKLEHSLAAKFSTMLGVNVTLKPEEEEILHFLDLLEATLYAREEVLMGNRLMGPKLAACQAALATMPIMRGPTRQLVEKLLSTPVSDDTAWLKELLAGGPQQEGTSD